MSAAAISILSASDTLPTTAELFFGRASLVSSELATAVCASWVAEQRMGSRRARTPFQLETGLSRLTPGVAIITVHDLLISRGAWVGSYAGFTSYEGIRAQVAFAKSDPTVSAVILDIDSSGGEVIGAFETAAVIRDLAKTKRTIAVVNGRACSAAYAIASAASEIVTIGTGSIGSIGVSFIHLDQSRKLANEGVRPTLIFAGSRKVDGNPFAALSPDARKTITAEIQQTYRSFLDCVGKGRGQRLTALAAGRTKAKTYIGTQAVKLGLADRVGTLDSVLATLAASRSSSVRQ